MDYDDDCNGGLVGGLCIDNLYPKQNVNVMSRFVRTLVMKSRLLTDLQTDTGFLARNTVRVYYYLRRHHHFELYEHPVFVSLYCGNNVKPLFLFVDTIQKTVGVRHKYSDCNVIKQVAKDIAYMLEFDMIFKITPAASLALESANVQPLQPIKDRIYLNQIA